MVKDNKFKRDLKDIGLTVSAFWLSLHFIFSFDIDYEKMKMVDFNSDSSPDMVLEEEHYSNLFGYDKTYYRLLDIEGNDASPISDEKFDDVYKGDFDDNGFPDFIGLRNFDSQDSFVYTWDNGDLKETTIEEVFGLKPLEETRNIYVGNSSQDTVCLEPSMDGSGNERVYMFDRDGDGNYEDFVVRDLNNNFGTMYKKVSKDTYWESEFSDEVGYDRIDDLDDI